MRFDLKRIPVLVFAFAICSWKEEVIRWAAGLFLALSVDGFQDPADCSTAFLGMNYTRCWVAPRRGYKRCVVAVAGGPRFGVLERISWDLVVGCLRRDPKDGLVKTRDGQAYSRNGLVHPVGVRVTPRGYV